MKGVNAYQTFGMSREWLAEFFQNPDTWWRCNSRGPRQFEAMRVWLRHAEIVDRKQNAITNVGRSLQLLGPDSRLAWAAMWTNLARNSALVRWYVHAVPFGREWSKADLVETMDNSLSLRTRQNAITSLVRLLVESPLGDELGLGRLQPAAATSRQYAKSGASDVPPLALLYCVYRYAERVNRYDLSVAELLADAQEGPSALFGVGEQALVRALRGLSSVHSTWIRAELVRDLDNIYLERTRGSAEVLALA